MEMIPKVSKQEIRIQFHVRDAPSIGICMSIGWKIVRLQLLDISYPARKHTTFRYVRNHTIRKLVASILQWSYQIIYDLIEYGKMRRWNLGPIHHISLQMVWQALCFRNISIHPFKYPFGNQYCKFRRSPLS